MGNYVTATQGEALDFGDLTRKQIFEHVSSPAKTMPEYILMKEFVALPREEQQITVEVMQFLYNFTFASRGQIERYLNLKKVNTNSLDRRLQQMLNSRQVNYFYLDLEEPISPSQPAPEDAFILYSLDFGALPILNHFTKQDSNVWFSTDAYRCEPQVMKYLKVVEFYLTLLEVQGPNLVAFIPHYQTSFKHLDFSVSAQFTICRDHKYGFFMLEVVGNDDLNGYWQKKLDEKISPFVTQNENWKKYFRTMPNFLLLVDNQEDGARAADYFFRRTELDCGDKSSQNILRMLTMDQMQKGLKAARFLKFIKGEDPNKGGELKVVTNLVLSNLEKASKPAIPTP